MIKYIKYVIDTIEFNYFYKAFYGSEISLFDNCSYKAYKRNTGMDKGEVLNKNE